MNIFVIKWFRVSLKKKVVKKSEILSFSYLLNSP